MLKGKCINPLIISALSHCGHGDKLLIADGNYPIDTMTADAETVYLSLSRACRRSRRSWTPS